MNVLARQPPDIATISVNLDAIAANVGVLRGRVNRPLMAVVKADAYGHGLVPSSLAALHGGADALGVTTLGEAYQLRDAGIESRILSWLHVPGVDYAPAIERAVEIGLSTIEALDEVAQSPGCAQVHLKIDTGLSRAGAPKALWGALVARAAEHARSGRVVVRGIWSHFAYADSPGHPTVRTQDDNLRDAAAVATNAGLSGFELHLANSAATLTDSDAWFDMVRPGLAIYGLDPMGGAASAHGLRPAMRASATVMMVKEVPAGTGVSYGHAYVTERATRLALVPVGYADGIPRAASNAAAVKLGGSQFPIAGRVCMDQFVVDVGDADVRAGDEAVLFGDPQDGDPAIELWSQAAATINYEVVARLGGRFSKRYTGELAAQFGLRS